MYLWAAAQRDSMKLASLLLAFYVLFLSLLPAVGVAASSVREKGCHQCCPKRSESTPKKKPAEKQTLANPFYGCTQCTATVLAPEFSFPVAALMIVNAQLYAAHERPYIAPFFDFWQPPKRI